MNPSVSVILPSYNYRRYIGQALDSVMAQTYRNFELLVVDDGSTDGSLDFLRDYQSQYPGKMRVLTHEGCRNFGLANTYREALKHASGEVVAFLESDDVWHPRNLEKKMKILEENQEVGVVFSRYRPFGWFRGVIYWKIYELANAAGIPMGRPVDLFSVFLKRNPVASFSHFIVRKELLDGIPPLETMRSNKDWWILAHLSLRTSFYMIPEFLCRWRIHRLSHGFGRADKKVLWKLHGFLLRLHQSLEIKNRSEGNPGQKAERQRQLSKALAFGKKLDERQWTVLLETLTRPFALVRFLCYIVLKNILFLPKIKEAR